MKCGVLSLILFSALGLAACTDTDLQMKESRIEQPLSHFNSSVPQKFQQRFFYSSKFARGPSAPVILWICIWSCSNEEVSANVGKYAREIGAHVVAVEHRFYGQSKPFTAWPSDTKIFQYLNTREAMLDIMDLKKRMPGNLGSTGKWIAYGCSYGASVAAYLRAHHPEEIAGAIAFSAPLKVKEEGIPEFSVAAQNTYGDLAKEVGELNLILVEMSRTQAGRERIRDGLQLPNTDFSTEDFKNILLVEIPFLAQSGLVPGLKVALESVPGEEAKALRMLQFFRENLVEAWLESPYGVRASPQSVSDVQMWNIQTYLEFKWNYVTAGAQSAVLFPFEQAIDYYRESWYPEEERFGVKSSIEFGQQIDNKIVHSASNLILLNGRDDPWSAVSHVDVNSSGRDAHSFFLPGNHCVGLTEDKNADPEVKKARAFIGRALRRWAR